MGDIAFDSELLDEAMRVGHHKTKKEAINSALKEYVYRHKQLSVIKLFGKVDYATEYNYKTDRKKR